MAIHFSAQELAERRKATVTGLNRRGLHGLLMFRQESMYYLTGYDTFGYCFFQCLYLGADGNLTLLTRAPDLRQAQHTSIIEDIRIWVDQAGKNPADDLRDILLEHGCKDTQLGIEFNAYGLTAYNWRLVETALKDFCALEDAHGKNDAHKRGVPFQLPDVAFRQRDRVLRRYVPEYTGVAFQIGSSGYTPADEQ